MSSATKRAVDPNENAAVSRELLAQMDQGSSLEDFTERRTASSAAALGVAASRGVRPPSA